MKKKFKIKFIRTDIGGSLFYSFFDNQGNLYYPPTLYLQNLLIRKQMSANTLENRASALKVYLQFLFDLSLPVFEVNDATIINYRNFLLSNVPEDPRKNINIAKRSINVYLRYIYDFHAWLQLENDQLKILGVSGCKIFSSLLVSTKNGQKDHYPACFKRVGEGSKHSIKFVPEPQDFRDLHAHLLEKNVATGSRNALMLEIIREVGLRVGSLASLSTELFPMNMLSSGRKTFLICPPIQKFGYTKQFEFPRRLIEAILHYIATDRQALIDQYGDNSRNVFLNVNNGEALKSHSISNIFIGAAKELGWVEKNQGPHCWRRFFSCETIQEEIDASIEYGLDTSIEAIGLRVAEKLGHNSVLSQEAYTRDMKRRQSESSTSQLKVELGIERDRANRLAKQLAELQHLMGKQ